MTYYTVLKVINLLEVLGLFLLSNEEQDAKFIYYLLPSIASNCWSSIYDLGAV